MTACMTAESGDIETVSDYINEARKMGFKILAPDVNESFEDFTVVVENGEITKNIRFGLDNIKNFGNEIARAVVANRKEKGPFTSLENFLERMTHRNLNKKSLEALTMSGALDSLGERGQLLANMEDMLAFNKECAKDAGAQGSLFAGLDDAPKAYLKLKDAPATDMKQNLAWEKELLGLYVTGHPLEKYADRFRNAKQTMAQIKMEVKDGSEIVVAGIVEEVKKSIPRKKMRRWHLFALQTLRDRSNVSSSQNLMRNSKNSVRLTDSSLSKEKFLNVTVNEVY